MEQKEETYSYKGWLNSDSFIKRVFAVLGYGIMGQIFVMLITLAIAALFTVLGLILGSF